MQANHLATARPNDLRPGERIFIPVAAGEPVALTQTVFATLDGAALQIGPGKVRGS